MRLIAVIFLFSFLAQANADIAPKKDWDFKNFASIPVLSGGRLKPFDSLARETVLQITGKREFQGWDPVDLMLSWITEPNEWRTKPFILITRKDLKRQIGLPEDVSRFSPEDLMAKSFLSEYASGVYQKEQGLSSQATPIAKTSKPDPREEELKRVLERVSLYQAVVSGEAWPLIPTLNTNEPWQNIAIQSHQKSQDSKSLAQDLMNSPLRKAILEALASYARGLPEQFKDNSQNLNLMITAQMGTQWTKQAQNKNAFEYFNNRFQPFFWAWVMYLLSALVWTAHQFSYSKVSVSGLKKTGFTLLITGFLLHIFGITLRCLIAGRPPVTNMYESIVWVSFGIVLFAWVLWWLQKNTVLFSVASALGAIGLIVADAAPTVMDPHLHPLVPVLRSNYWLTIHVLTITISYAAFALALGLGNVALWKYIRGEHHHADGMKKITTLNLLNYRALQFGVVLLAAGTILGGVWADYSWGRFWGWDPKEVWALIALMGYLVILHARFTGWIKPFSFAAWSVICFTLVLMAWYGVNFVLGVGLHSYGFSSGGGQGFVALSILLQWAYIAYAAIKKGATLRLDTPQAG